MGCQTRYFFFKAKETEALSEWIVNSHVTSLSILSNGIIVMVANDGRYYMFEWSHRLFDYSYKFPELFPPLTDNSSLYYVASSPDSNLLACESDKGTVLWDVRGIWDKELGWDNPADYLGVLGAKEQSDSG